MRVSEDRNGITRRGLGSIPHRFKICSCTWIRFKMLEEQLAGIVCTECARREVPCDYTLPDFTLRTAREQSRSLSTTTIAIGNILGEQVHAILFATQPRNFSPHGMLSCRILFLRREKDWTPGTVKTAIGNRGIHSSGPAGDC
jgi:hypothetical protein